MKDLIIKDIESKHPYVPGQSLQWFKPGTPERAGWLKARKKFFETIFPKEDDKEKFLESVVESMFESELPTSWLGIITSTWKIFGKARRLQQQKTIWKKTIDSILELIFTMQNDIDEEFIFSYSQVSRIWQAYSNKEIERDDYFRLHSIIDTKLKLGLIKTEILKYPELDSYISYKLRFFIEVVNRFKLL